MSIERPAIPAAVRSDASSHRSQPARRSPLAAEAEMLRAFADNSWFIGRHWPQNRERILGLVGDIVQRYPPEGGAHVLDVGCFNGSTSLLLALLGFRVTGVDAMPYPERDRLFAEHGIEFATVNLNDLAPLRGIADETFDAVLAGEVFEHVLNHPLGLLREFRRVLRPGGALALSTPNPSTLQGAARLLFGRTLMWGTDSFLDEPKFSQTAIIANPEVHYREYTADELLGALRRAGFRPIALRYMGMGTDAKQHAAKRFLKATPIGRAIMRARLTGTTQVHVAVRE
jgi:2-polyprenyl-3-methyl-5-hydroxy-6-metoxy-1,4-benzoquinol methylase